MITLKKYGRTWHINGTEQLLSPWAENVEDIPGTLIKKNKNRQVRLVSAADGNHYYVKREKKFHFPFSLSKAEKEYQAFALLERKGIPCVECSAWSATAKDSILVTKALPGTFCSILEYWYKQPEADQEFLQKLCLFLANTVKAGITHPDFHAGNLMTDGEKIVLLDPVGISETVPTDSPASGMLIPLVIAFGDIPLKIIAGILHRAGSFVTEDEALSILYQVEKQQHDLIRKEWEKRRKQILSGTSKFATEVESGKFIRNSAWFAPMLNYQEDSLETEEFPAAEAEEIWVDSFRSQLQKTPCKKIPVIYKRNGAKSTVSFLTDKKYSFFYGFR